MAFWIRIGVWIWLAAASLCMIDQGTGSNLEPGFESASPTGFNTEPKIQEDCNAMEALRNKTADLFRRRISREEYYRRNWMWIRCRGKRVNRLDMGGSWFGPEGRDFKRYLENMNCGSVLNWRFKYVNGEWGDATLRFNWLLSCGLKTTIAVASSLARVAGERYKREFYILNCPRASMDPNWASEFPGFGWPYKGAMPRSRDNRSAVVFNFQKQLRAANEGDLAAAMEV